MGTSPPRRSMDYKAAVSPSRGGAAFFGQNHTEPNSHFNVASNDYGYHVDNMGLADNAGYEPFNGKHPAARPPNLQNSTPADIPNEQEPADQEEEDYQGQLHDILEDEPEDEDDKVQGDQQDGGYIERHNAWVDVLDENLQKTRRNLAARDASEGVEMDMGELLSAVEDIIEITGEDGDVATYTMFLYSRLLQKASETCKTILL
ncbi:hypothetical protein R1sor_023398 [Riccia sorocarpa]|uniref:Uncharacterized protein n=1 Tax=Riccia sorocarpa TaxID=122646 RepID=A0ABD3GPN3_9MARC